MAWCKAYFGILKCLGTTHKYDGQARHFYSTCAVWPNTHQLMLH